MFKNQWKLFVEHYNMVGLVEEESLMRGISEVEEDDEGGEK